MKQNEILNKLEELALGQQRIELSLKAHLDDHKLSFKRLTSIYIPTFGIALPAISFLISWFSGKRH